MSDKYFREPEESFLDEVKSTIARTVKRISDWMRPKESQSTLLQILVFMLKLPVLIVLLALSPIFLVIMLFVFLAAI